MVVSKVKPQQYFWMLCLQPWLVFTISSLSRLHLVNLVFTHLDNLLLRTDCNGKFSLACDLVKIITLKRYLFPPFCYSFLPNTWRRRVMISLNLLLPLFSNGAARQCCSIPAKSKKLNSSFSWCTRRQPFRKKVALYCSLYFSPYFGIQLWTQGLHIWLGVHVHNIRTDISICCVCIYACYGTWVYNKSIL